MNANNAPGLIADLLTLVSRGSLTVAAGEAQPQAASRYPAQQVRTAFDAGLGPLLHRVWSQEHLGALDQCGDWLRAARLTALVRHGRPLRAPSATALEPGDEVWLLASPDQLEHLTTLFAPQEQSSQLAVRSFFGEFVLDAESSAADLAAAYGLPLEEGELAGSTADLLCRRLGRRPVVGDRIGIGSMELTVRAVAGNRVTSVGLKMSRGR